MRHCGHGPANNPGFLASKTARGKKPVKMAGAKVA